MSHLIKLLFLVVLSCVCMHGNAQHKNLQINPLLRVLQSNSDSCIVYYPFSNWDDGAARYYIITHNVKRNDYNGFKYENPYQGVMGRSFPKMLQEKMYKEFYLFQNTVPDTNRYFRPYFFDLSFPGDIVWQQLLENGVWNFTANMIDDSNYPEPADAGETIFFLITKKSIRKVYFYAVENYYRRDSLSPPLNKVYKTIKTFREAFKTVY